MKNSIIAAVVVSMFSVSALAAPGGASAIAKDPARVEGAGISDAVKAAKEPKVKEPKAIKAPKEPKAVKAPKEAKIKEPKAVEPVAPAPVTAP